MKKLLILLLLVPSLSWGKGYNTFLLERCGFYITESEKNEMTRQQLKMYVGGFFSGKLIEQDKTIDIDLDSLFMELENYCKANPLTLYTQALLDVYERTVPFFRKDGTYK